MTRGAVLRSLDLGEVSADTVAQFSLAVGDTNPVHHDREVAARIGLPGVVAPGAMAATVLLCARDRWRPDWTDVKIKFSRWCAAETEWRVAERSNDICLFAGHAQPSAVLRPIKTAT